MTDPKRIPPNSGSAVLAAAISTVLAMANSGAALAAEQLEEVVVTATRRAERLQDVPESITAFDSKDIALRGLQNLDDLARMVPGMSMSMREPGGSTIVFRGVVSSGNQFGSVSSSGLYLDDQPITQSGRNPDPRLIDIERIEALRGPQGTLYGASSQSGTLRVITNKPNPEAFDAWVDGEVSTTHKGGTGYDLSAMVNLPLADNRLALRLVGFTTEDAGFIDNVLSDSQGGTFTNANVVEKDVNSKRTDGGRAALRWDITDKVNATVSAIFQDVSANGHGDINLGAGDLNQVRFEKESLDDRWYQVALALNASLPFGDAVISATYFDRDFRYEADATDYEFRFNSSFTNCTVNYENCSPVYDFGGDPRGFARNHEQTEITTFEARLASPSDSTSRWAWLVGGYYSQEKGHTTFDSYVRNYQDTGSFNYFSEYEANLSGSPLAPTERWFLGRYDTELDQVAVFGELSFDITENFKITAGGRWFDYDRKFAQHQEQPEGFSGYSLLDANQKTSENGSVTKLNFTYQFDRDRLVYATYSEGFRVGGSNPLKDASILPRNYGSDDVQNFEVGLKSEWLENRLRLNFAAFYMKWNDFAVQVEDPQPAVFQLGYVNLPSAEIPGVEAEWAFTLSDEWLLDGTFGWSDAKIAEATTLTLADAEGEEFSFDIAKGARLPLTPDWTATVGIEFRSQARVLQAQPFARFDFSYVGESVNSIAGIDSVVSGNPVEKQKAYQTGDLRFGLERDQWTGSIFIDNIWDERANLYLSNRWAVQRQSINRPRTIGVQFRYNF